jgi:ribosomal-protein-alanine N-acetyltransferase
LRVRDGGAWSDLRIRNESWLTRWEGRPPDAPETTWAERHSPATYASMLRVLRRESKAGRCLPFAVTYDRALVGQVTVQNVVRGAFHSGTVGYWVDESVAGKGVMSTAVALVVDHCFGPVGLHRVEANVRPENTPSLRLVEKVGFRPEGERSRYLFIDGAWRDHLGFALTVEDLPGGALARLQNR